MAQLYFKYGTMGSGKSLDLLTTAYNYKKQNKNVIIYTSKLDTRSKKNKVESRVGLKENAEYLPDNKQAIVNDLLKKIEEAETKNISCILVDESQFLSEEQIKTLAYIVDTFKIPVICWGLKNDFQNKLFSGSEVLLAYADKLEQIKTICTICNKKATMNLRLNNGKAVYTGEQIMVGDEEYIPVCRNCYMNYNEIIKENL